LSVQARAGQMLQSGQFNLGQKNSTRLLDLAEEIVAGYETITGDIEVISHDCKLD